MAAIAWIIRADQVSHPWGDLPCRLLVETRQIRGQLGAFLDKLRRVSFIISDSMFRRKRLCAGEIS